MYLYKSTKLIQNHKFVTDIFKQLIESCLSQLVSDVTILNENVEFGIYQYWRKFDIFYDWRLLF